MKIMRCDDPMLVYFIYGHHLGSFGCLSVPSVCNIMCLCGKVHYVLDTVTHTCMLIPTYN